ncbi:MAG: CHAT domain-containing tetratricopeptide repeat protein [Vicinamibacteraceae bacterium]
MRAVSTETSSACCRLTPRDPRSMHARALVLSLAVVAALGARPAVCQPADGAAAVPAGLASVQQLLDQGRYADAEAEARALHVGETALPAPLHSAATALYVEALLRNGRGGEPNTLALARSLPASGRTLRLLGSVLVQAGGFEEAITRFTEAARLEAGARGLRHPRVADALDGLARASMWLERYGQALRASNRAVAIYEAHQPADPSGLARVLTTRGSLLQGMALFDKARVDLERAAGIGAGLDPRHPELVGTLTALGEELQLEGELVESRTVLERAVAIAERSLRDGHPDLASALRALAVPLTEAGELEPAKAAVERGLTIAERAYGPVHPLVAMQLNDLADSYVLLGQYAEARPLQQRALDIYERSLGRRSSYVATAVLNLALLNELWGDHREAERLHRRAIATWQAVVGRSHTYLAWALIGLGDAVAGQDRLVEARVLYARALSIREKRLGRRHDQVAEVLIKLADTLARLGQEAAATPLADRALAIALASHNPVAKSDALLVRARLDLAAGRYAVARNRLSEALEIRTPVFGAAHPSVADAQAALAVALAGVDRPAEAFDTAMNAERVGRDHLRLTTSSLAERQALAYAASRPHGLDLALSVRPSPAADAPLLDAVIRSRALVLDEMATRQQLRAGATGDELRPYWRTLESASRRLANLAVRGPGDLAPERYADVLRVARTQKEQAEIALATRGTALRQTRTDRNVGFADVRRSLDANTALVSFVRYAQTTFEGEGPRRIRRTAPAYAAFVTRADRERPTFVPLGAASSIETLITRWRLLALGGITPQGGVRPRAEAVLRDAGTLLGARIWDPLDAHLHGIGRAFVVPDGAINLVPFAALPRGGSDYLLDTGPAIHYLSAERDLVEYAVAPSARPGRGLLALGGPAYGSLPATGRAASLRSSSNTADSNEAERRRSACGTFATLVFPDLPASRREVEDISSLWRSLVPTTASDAPVLLTGARAGEAAFKASSSGYRVLHLATHGFFLGADCASDSATTRGVVAKVTRPATRPLAPGSPESPLLLSGLALSGANRRFGAHPQAEDGILTAEEVAALDLDGLEWAVLSACDTGLGEIRAGEGVFGLRRAFRTAGARTVIMSLWPVEDRAARAWMQALYRARLQDHLSTADAMRQASLDILAQRRAAKRSTHPLFWAGFVAAGDWR